MMKFTQPASGNARRRFRLGNSKLITVPPTVRLLLDSWDSGWDWTTLGLPGKLASSAVATERSSHFQESRDSSPPRRGSGCAMVVNEKAVKLSRSPEPNCYSPQAPEKG